MHKKYGMIYFLLILLIASTFSQSASAHTVNPNGQATTKEVMNWLANLSSENRVVSGAFGGYTNASFSMIEANRIENATGQSPAVYGCDYSRGWMETSNIADSIDYSCNTDLISHWKNGGIP